MPEADTSGYGENSEGLPRSRVAGLLLGPLCLLLTLVLPAPVNMSPEAIAASCAFMMTLASYALLGVVFTL